MHCPDYPQRGQTAYSHCRGQHPGLGASPSALWQFNCTDVEEYDESLQRKESFSGPKVTAHFSFSQERHIKLSVGTHLYVVAVRDFWLLFFLRVRERLRDTLKREGLSQSFRQQNKKENGRVKAERIWEIEGTLVENRHFQGIT